MEDFNDWRGAAANPVDVGAADVLKSSEITGKSRATIAELSIAPKLQNV